MICNSRTFCRRSGSSARTCQFSSIAPRVYTHDHATGSNLAPTAGEPHSGFKPSPDSLTAGSTSRCPFLASLPTPPPSPISFFDTVNIFFNPIKFQAKALAHHEIVASPGYLGIPPLYVVGNFGWAKTVLQGEEDISLPIGKKTSPGFAKLVGENNVLMAPEPHHKYLRNLIMPALTPEAVEELLPRAVAIISAYLEAWTDAPEPVKVADELRSLTFDFIIKSIMGRDFAPAELQHIKALYITWAEGIFAWPFMDLPFTPFGRAMAARAQLVRVFQQEIELVRQQQSVEQEVAGILGNMVSAEDEQGNRLTDAELQDNLLVLVLAGHDTTSSTLTNVLALLQDYPDAWAKLCAEQEQLAAKHGSKIDAAVLKDMAYGDAIIRESLRVRNIVSSLTRVASRDFELGGYKVPAGMALNIPITLLSKQDPRWVDDEPDAFRPERMLVTGPDGRPHHASPGHMMPFGLGPRFCAGYWVAMAEMRVFLALLARGYEFSADTNTAWRNNIGPSPVNGLPVILRRRPQMGLHGGQSQ